MDMSTCKECKIKYKVIGMADAGVCPFCEDLTKPFTTENVNGSTDCKRAENAMADYDDAN